MIVIVMGVTGAGKTTVAKALVALTGWHFAEGDDFPGAAVIVGATSRMHLAANVAAGALKLTDSDRAETEAVATKRRGPEGDVYELERDRAGRHGSIMKYNLSAEHA